jgi:hypothetical protein
MTVLPKGGYRARTRLNVSDSDGTAIIYRETLKGGTRLTRNLCALLKRPYVLINVSETPEPAEASGKISRFIEENKIATSNVAGPRASGWLRVMRSHWLLQDKFFRDSESSIGYAYSPE